jgi:hypothetical protein
MTSRPAQLPKLSAVAPVRRFVAKGESETLELKRSTGELREGMETLYAPALREAQGSAAEAEG